MCSCRRSFIYADPSIVEVGLFWALIALVLSIYTYRHGFTSLPMEKANTSIVMASNSEPAI